MRLKTSLTGFDAKPNSQLIYEINTINVNTKIIYKIIN